MRRQHDRARVCVHDNNHKFHKVLIQRDLNEKCIAQSVQRPHNH